jgi:hypothetical protein
MAKYGFSALNQNLNANANNGFAVKQAISQANLIKAVRVLSIVLDESHPRFKELGEWNGLGIIEYEDVNNPLPSPSLPTARALSGNFKNLPLVNEIVYLVGFPNTDIDTISSNTVEYYLNIVSLWNHPHHNAYPTAPNALPPTQQKDYVQTEGGNVRRVTDQSTEIFLGKTFKERSNIHPLLPFEGDILYEGRWGNSIRLGSTNILSSNTIIPKNESFNINYSFNLNNTSIPQSIISELDLINNKINLFKGKYQNVIVSTFIDIGETFDDTIFLGNLINILDKKYSSINQSVRTNIKIGIQYSININIIINGTQSLKTKNKSLNNWSSVGTSGDPIIIIRNGQGIQTEEGWIPTEEDINNDDSSIYQTSTQKIPLKASSVNYLSYPSNPPQTPDQYAGKQIILNSGRLVFNSTLDHILLSSKKSINLNAVESVNIDTPTTIIQSNKVLLGSKNATEPVLLGNSTISTLNNLIDNLGAFLQVCSTVIVTSSPGDLIPLNLAANQLFAQLKVIQGNLEKLKSKSNFTV